MRSGKIFIARGGSLLRVAVGPLGGLVIGYGDASHRMITARIVLRTPVVVTLAGDGKTRVWFTPSSQSNILFYGLGLRPGEAAWGGSGTPIRTSLFEIAPPVDPRSERMYQVLMAALLSLDRTLSIPVSVDVASNAALVQGASFSTPVVTLADPAEITIHTPQPREVDLAACKTCRRVFSAAHGRTECPAFPGGGGCDRRWSGSPRFVVYHAATPIPGDPGRGCQEHWSLCWKCKGLFFALGAASSACPRGGTHERGFSLNLKLLQDIWEIEDLRATNVAKWCSRCQSLFVPGVEGTQGVCSAGAGGHDGASSGGYWIHYAEKTP